MWAALLLVLMPQFTPALLVPLLGVDGGSGITVPVETFVQYGFPGIFIALLISGQIVLGREAKELRIDRDRERQRNEDIVQSLASVPEVLAANLESLRVIQTLLEGIQEESRRQRGTN